MSYTCWRKHMYSLLISSNHLTLTLATRQAQKSKSSKFLPHLQQRIKLTVWRTKSVLCRHDCIEKSVDCLHCLRNLMKYMNDYKNCQEHSQKIRYHLNRFISVEKLKMIFNLDISTRCYKSSNIKIIFWRLLWKRIVYTNI